MAEQVGNGIPFEISISPQNIRLLELPPALLELIRSEHPPDLTLKSIANGTSNGANQTPAHAVLCTNDNTYQIRQVQSSNSVFILQPSETPKPAEESQDPVTGVSAIAQCPTLLELIPTSASSIAFLKHNLPIYKGSEVEAGLDPELPPEKQGKQALLQDAPFSSGEFNLAWRDLCVFESGGQAWLPAAQALANCWKSVTSAATVRSLELGEAFAMAALADTVEEDGHPVTLFEAVIARLSADERDMMEGYAKLDKDKCVPWVGAVLLEAQSGGLSTKDFVRIWQDQLPEGWRQQASLEKLKGKYSQPTKTTIIFDGHGSAGKAAQSVAPKAPTAKGKPNWHEKFKNSKR